MSEFEILPPLRAAAPLNLGVDFGKQRAQHRRRCLGQFL
jgi:hypothetical protein